MRHHFFQFGSLAFKVMILPGIWASKDQVPETPQFTLFAAQNVVNSTRFYLIFVIISTNVGVTV